MQFLGEKLKWACGPCDLRLGNLLAKLSDVDSFINLSETVDKLVTIVKGVVNDNLVLNDRINQVESSHNRLEILMHRPSVGCDSDILDVSQSSELTNLLSFDINNGDAVSDPKVLESKASGTGNTGISLVPESIRPKPNTNKKSYANVLNTNNKVPSKENIKSAVSHKDNRNIKSQLKRSKPIIIGSNLVKSGLKSVEKPKWIFVSRCSPDTTVTEIEQYISKEGIEGSKGEKLKTRYTEYSSFKVSVFEKYLDRVLHADFWPKGLFVKEFRPPRSNFVKQHVSLKENVHADFLEKK